MNYREKPPQCEGCPAHAKGLGFVEASPRKESRVLLVLDGPDELAARFSTPIAWKTGAGRMLARWIGASEVGPVHVTNVVRCYLPARYEKDLPKGKRGPTLAEAEFCRRVHLDPTIKELLDEKANSGRSREDLGKPTCIVTVGADAARAVRGIKGSVESSIGVFDRVPVSGGEDL